MPCYNIYNIKWEMKDGDKSEIYPNQVTIFVEDSVIDVYDYLNDALIEHSDHNNFGFDYELLTESTVNVIESNENGLVTKLYSYYNNEEGNQKAFSIFLEKVKLLEKETKSRANIPMGQEYFRAENGKSVQIVYSE